MPASPNAWWSARARWPSTSTASSPSWTCPRPKATIGGSWQCCGSWKARAPPSGADLIVWRGVSARLRERGASLGANSGLGGAINLAATDDAPELLLSDGLVEDQLSQDPTVVRKARATFTSVRADALNRPDSRNTLTEAMERWTN